MPPPLCYVVTGGAQGVGRAIAERLARTGGSPSWTSLRRDGRGLRRPDRLGGQQRAVRGALPYATAKATAKAAVEGLTRAVAVDHGPAGIRTNAVALGSISTEGYESHRAAHPEVDAQMAALHPLGRVGTTAEVADVVPFLLSPAAGSVDGVVLPVDGGRAANGPDPEAR